MRLSSLEIVNDRQVKVHGEMTFTTISPLLAQSQQLFNNYKHLAFDLSNVTQTDSAGLALLIEWLRIAQQKQLSVNFINMPAQLMNIAKVCNLDKILFNVN